MTAEQEFDLILTVAKLKVQVEQLQNAMRDMADEQGRLRAAQTVSRYGI